MRTYNYNQNDLQHLFARIIEWLGKTDTPDNTITNILTEVCNHFRFGCGFVYEADHTHMFHLKEHVAVYQAINLKKKFTLESYLTADELSNMALASLLFRESRQKPDKNATAIFDANTLMVVPVMDSENRIVGLVGMMDRRRNILMDEQAVQAGKMVLNLLANYIKLRIVQRNLEYAQQALVGILDNTGVDIYVTDYDTHEILYVNKSMAEPYGGRTAMLGKKCWQVLYDDKPGECEYCPKRKLVDEEGNPVKVFTWDYQRPFDGSWFRVLSAAFPWVDGRRAHVVSSVDITDNNPSVAKNAKIASDDSLPSLPNRRKLMNDINEAIASQNSTGAGVYLLFYDLDNFKKLNDSVGHQAGDELLIKVGEALQNNTLTADRSYRYGGDEFVTLLTNTSREDAVGVASSILNLFEQPWQLEEVCAECRASLGGSRYPDDAADADALLRAADKMMYKAKRMGRGMACFTTGDFLKPSTGKG